MVKTMREPLIVLSGMALICCAWRLDVGKHVDVPGPVYPNAASYSRPGSGRAEALTVTTGPSETERTPAETGAPAQPGRNGEAQPRPDTPMKNVFDGVLPRLKAIFSGAGVPPGLIWMAEIESGWDAQAVSPDGAAGLFQIMPGTARQYGLKTGRKDERVHPYKSAKAAAVYLRSLYDEFGSWHLALAAYNAGDGRVRRLLRRSGASSYSEIAMYLPAETRSYVPRVMAMMVSRESEARNREASL